MSRYGQIMIHQPMSDVFGNAAKLKDCVAHLEQIENTLCEIYAARTGKSVEEIRATYMDGRDHWLTAEEALAEGFIDEIFDDDRTAVSASLTPRERCERYTALYIEHVSLKNQEQMINKLRSMPAFSDCADEAAVMSRITEVVNKAQEHAAVVASATPSRRRSPISNARSAKPRRRPMMPRSTRHARRSASAPTKCRVSRR